MAWPKAGATRFGPDCGKCLPRTPAALRSQLPPDELLKVLVPVLNHGDVAVRAP